MFVNNGSDDTTVEYIRKSLADDGWEKRSIQLVGETATLDKIERMIGYMEYLGSVGHSTSFTVFVDGDGGFSIRTKDNDGKALCKKHKSEDYPETRDKNGDVDAFRFE